MRGDRWPGFLSTRYQRDKYRRRVIAAVAVAVAAWLIVNLADQGRDDPGPVRPNPGCACAGYWWSGQVTSVAARWTVPRLGTRTFGFASDWIGAQTGGSGGRFIQIGVTETSDIPQGLSNMHMPQSDYTLSYTAFWSDTDRGYHPIQLGRVRPGDVVHASLRLAGGRWRMHLSDRRTPLDVTLSTRQEAAGPLHAAEWSQEDVAAGKDDYLPYPRLSSFTFGDLKVDGHDPAAHELIPFAMPARSRLILSPGHVAADRFVVGPARDRPPPAGS